MVAMRLHHLAFRTRKLRKLARFYSEVVGLPTVRVNKLQSGRIRSVWLDAGGTLLMLEAVSEGDEPAIPRGTCELVCFGARSKKDVAWRRDKVRRHVRIEAETDYTFYFRDPDGRRVAISCFRWQP
jgi:catechol 2,3-dioxygenase-like lactoylglutathione lyase family enzyme